MISKLKNKEFFWNTFGQLVQMVGAIVIMKLLAIYLAKGEYGKFALINSLVALFMILPFNAIIHGIYRYVAEYMDTKRFSKFFSINIFMVSIIFIGAYIAICFALQFFDFELKQYFLLVSLLVLSEIYKTMLKYIENARRYRKKIAFSSLLEFASKIILIVSLAWLEVISVENILIVLIIGNTISILVLMYRNWIHLHIPLFDNYYKIFIPIVVFGIPLIFSQLFGWARDMSGRWFLEIYVDSESVAIFALMATIAAIIPSGLNSFIGSYLVPILYQKEHSDKGYTKKILKKIIPQLLFGVVFVTIIIYFLRDFIVLILTDKKYVDYSWMLTPMFFTFSLYVISMIASYEIYSQKKTKLLIFPAFVAALVAIVSGYLLTIRFGLAGAFTSYLITYTSYAFVMFYIVFFKKVSYA